METGLPGGEVEIHDTDQEGTASNGAQRKGSSLCQALLPAAPWWELCGPPSTLRKRLGL